MTTVNSLNIVYRLPCHPDEEANSKFDNTVMESRLYANEGANLTHLVSIEISAGMMAADVVAMLEEAIVQIKNSARGCRFKEVFWDLGGMTQEDIAKQAAYKASVSASMKKVFPEMGAAK